MAADAGAARRRLLHPAVYPHTVKWAHRREWEESIRQSHPPSPPREALLARFQAEVGVIGRALGPVLAAAGVGGGAGSDGGGVGAAGWAEATAAQAWFP